MTEKNGKHLLEVIEEFEEFIEEFQLKNFRKIKSDVI